MLLWTTARREAGWSVCRLWWAIRSSRGSRSFLDQRRAVSERGGQSSSDGGQTVRAAFRVCKTFSRCRGDDPSSFEVFLAEQAVSAGVQACGHDAERAKEEGYSNLSVLRQIE